MYFNSTLRVYSTRVVDRSFPRKATRTKAAPEVEGFRKQVEKMGGKKTDLLAPGEKMGLIEEKKASFFAREHSKFHLSAISTSTQNSW